jgi:hypothetical protein
MFKPPQHCTLHKAKQSDVSKPQVSKTPAQKEKPKLKIQPSCKLYLLKRKLPAHLTTAQSQQQSSEPKKPSDQPASQEEYLQYLRFKNKMVADFEKEQKIKRILTQKRPPT